MMLLVKVIKDGKETSRNLTAIPRVKDLDRLKGPGMTTETIMKLKHKGAVKVKMTDGSTLEMVVLL